MVKIMKRVCPQCDSPVDPNPSIPYTHICKVCGWIGETTKQKKTPEGQVDPNRALEFVEVTV